MTLETWTEVFVRSFQELWFGVVSFIPNLIVSLVILVLGWLIGLGVQRIIAGLVDSLRIDTALRNAGVEAAFERAGIRLHAGTFLGALVKWFIVAAFLLVSFEILGLTQVTFFLREVILSYLPKVIVAVVMILVAAMIAEVIYNIVVAGAKAARITSAHLAGLIAKWAIWLFAILAVMSQLGIAEPFVQTLFTGIVVAFSIALGLAFGLGGQQIAARHLDRLEREFVDKK